MYGKRKEGESWRKKETDGWTEWANRAEGEGNLEEREREREREEKEIKEREGDAQTTPENYRIDIKLQ